MEEHEYLNNVREIGFYFIVAPAIILFGLAITGSMLDSLLGTDRTFY